MTPIEIMALIVAVLGSIKLIVILLNPKSWLDGAAKTAFSNPVLTTMVSLVLAAVTLMYLLEELTIIQIFAVMLFLMFLMAAAIAPYSKEIIAMGDKILKDRGVVKKGWLAIIIWAVLIIWVLYAIFV
ncbi:hypothetical protein BEH94_02580 [Candidatus Altiarchaeales archaeon WOR_SM1_SCG]|nr:hypothetical protein BEH94_02580 [Candidatus Altiarchaeales archaeon WOR_SM1_SCG]